jgi:dihydroorotase
MNPPLRDEADRAALREGLSNGLIDVIATDHAPHHAAEKEKDFIEAPFGVSGLETAFSLLFTHLVETGIISLSRLVSCLSTAPARILGVPGGTISPGTAADLTVIDIRAQREVKKDNLYSLGKNTPFHGWVLRGFPVLTMVEGDVKMCRGAVKGMSEAFDAVRETVLREGRL